MPLLRIRTAGQWLTQALSCNTAANSDEESRGSYFDVLPEDVLVHIAKAMMNDGSRFTAGKADHQVVNYENIFPFVAGNASHRQAVLKALDYTLKIFFHEEQKARDIASLFRDEVKELCLIYYRTYKIPKTLRCHPQLKKVAVMGSRQHLGALRGFHGIEQLHVHVLGSSCLESLVQTLKNNQISKLTLSSSVLVGSERKFRLREEKWQRRLAGAGDSIKIFRWKGFHPIYIFWTFVTGLESLEELIVHGDQETHLIDEQFVPFLRTLKKIHWHTSVPINWAVRIGAPIRGITHSLNASAATIDKLINFRNLHALNLDLQRGAEKALLNIPLHNLETLVLAWGTKNAERLRQAQGEELRKWYQDENVVNSRENDLHEPDDSVILGIVGKTTGLKDLSLREATVKMGTFMKILQHVGPSLGRMEVSLHDKFESIPSQVEVILRSIPRHCPKLYWLFFYVDKAVVTNGDQIERCKEALRRLRRFCPRLITSNHIQKMVDEYAVDGL